MENQSTTIPLHHPGSLEMTSFFVQGLIVSVAISVFLETLARNYIELTIPGDIGYVILVTVFAPVIEEFTKVFPLLNRHAETEKSIVKLGFLSGLGFGFAEFLVYVIFFGAPISIRFPEMFFHAANTAIVAYGIAKHKFLAYYSIAVFFHFASNALTFTGDIWYIGGLGIIVLVYYLGYSAYSKSSDSFLE